MKKIIFLFLFFSSFVALAQSGTIKGTVTEAGGESLAGISVFIKSINKGTTTEFEGTYILEKIPAGTYNVEFSYIGYATVTKSVAVVANQTVTLNAEIKESASALDEVVITASKKAQKLTDVPATVNIISSKDIQNFIDHAEHESGELGYTMDGLRVYLGAYPSTKEETGLTTMFIVPTGPKSTSKASSLNLFLPPSDGDIPAPPLNEGQGNSNGYPQ